MSVSTNYSTPVNVNGYACKNCTDVDYAKKHIDPAHPKDGPYGVAKTDAARTDSTRTDSAKAAAQASASRDSTPAVTFGGNLSPPTAAISTTTNATATGGLLNLSV